MKKFLVVFVLLFFGLQLNVFSLEKNYVIDNASILSDDTLEYINYYSYFLDDNYDIDYYVITENNLGDMDSSEYVKKLYKSYNLSKKGILIFVCTDDREIRVEVGEELSSIITSNIIDEYIDLYFIHYLRDNEWDNGIKNGYSSFYKLLCNYYDIDSSSMSVYNDNFVSKYKNYIIMAVIWFITIIGYIFSEYFYKIFIRKDKNNININTILFGICLLISMLLLNLTYLIAKKAVIIVFLFELFAFITNLRNILMKPNKKKNKKVRKIVK